MRKLEHDSIVNSAILHPNQSEIIFGDEEGKVKIWDLSKNESRELYEDPDEVGIRSLDMTKDGTKLAASNSAGGCFLWSTTEGDDFVPF